MRESDQWAAALEPRDAVTGVVGSGGGDKWDAAAALATPHPASASAAEAQEWEAVLGRQQLAASQPAAPRPLVAVVECG